MRHRKTSLIKQMVGVLATLSATALSMSAPRVPSARSRSKINTDTALQFAQGITINGILANDHFGVSIVSDDFNGDGRPDLAVGAFYTNPMGREEAGTVYILWGPPEGEWPRTLELASPKGVNVTTINGAAAGDWTGSCVALAGDPNGDGRPDLLIGTRTQKNYVLWGTNTTWASPMDLADLNPTIGSVMVSSVEIELLGSSTVAPTGDLNGDEIDDLAVAIPTYSSESQANPGTTFIVWGKKYLWPTTVNLSIPGEINVTTINGTLGYAMAPIHNIDRLGDLAIAAPRAAPGGRINAGAIFILHGKKGIWPPTLDLATQEFVNITSINGISAYDQIGHSVASADLDGDGEPDLIIGAPYVTVRGEYNVGVVNIVWGNSTWSGTIELAAPGSVSVTTINGILASDETGFYVSDAGDPNGDGVRGVLIGAPKANREGRDDTGTVSLLRGKKGAWPPTIELSDMDETMGIVFTGVARGDNTGWSVAPAYNFKDGRDSILIGAPFADPGGRIIAGSVYVVLGSNFFPTLTNQLNINRGETRQITSAQLFISDQTSPVPYQVHNVSHGQFEFASGTPIYNFTSDDITADRIYFAHDDSNEPPYYEIVPQGSVLLPQSSFPASINFTGVVAPSTPAPTTAVPTTVAPTNTAAPTTAAPTTATPPTETPAPTSTGAPTDTPTTEPTGTQGLPTEAPEPTNTVTPTTYTPPDSNNSSNAALIALLSIGSIAIVALFLVYYIHQKKMHSKVDALALKVENSSDNINGALSSLAHQLFNQIKTTGLFGYRNDQMTLEYLEGLQLILASLKRKGVDPATLNHQDQQTLLAQIIREIRTQLVPNEHPIHEWLNFSAPRFLPAELKRKALNIASAVFDRLHIGPTGPGTKAHMSAFPLLHYVKAEMDLIDEFDTLKGVEYLKTFNLLIDAFKTRGVDVLNMAEPQLQLFSKAVAHVLETFVEKPADVFIPIDSGSHRDQMREPLLPADDTIDASKTLDLEQIKQQKSDIVNATLRKYNPTAAVPPAAAAHITTLG